MANHPLEPLHDKLLSYHPNLIPGQNYAVTSSSDGGYNCVAWAANDLDHWWWPSIEPEDAFWPEDVPREATIEAFAAAFATLGFIQCDSPAVELGYEKVAIFVDSDHVPTHAARQLPSGRWTSKLGYHQDIEHAALEAVSDSTYGTVQLVLRRRHGEEERG